MIETVFVFGDSIVMGLWDDRGGWAERLWKGRSRIVYNLGVDGNTSEDVVGRFQLEAENRGAGKNSAIIFAVGVNDSSQMNGSHRVSLPSYLRNMEELITRARKFTQKIFCVGLGPIDQSKSVPFILEESISFYSKDRDEYDRALEKLCGEKDVRYISLRNTGIETHLSEDGVHPLTSGHQIIADKVAKSITPAAYAN